METFYKTVSGFSESFLKEKGSKFIGLCTPCSTEEEIKGYLSAWKALHPQATHLCYAYKIGVRQVKQRASDDGEPSNSAGAPILGQIQSFALTNILVGVVRYYGGTKLGVGGLVSAYRSAAKKAIEENELIEKELSVVSLFSFSYEDMPSIMDRLKYWNIPIRKQQIDLNCELEVEYPESKSVEIRNFITSFDSVKLIKETKEI